MGPCLICNKYDCDHRCNTPIDVDEHLKEMAAKPKAIYILTQTCGKFTNVLAAYMNESDAIEEMSSQVDTFVKLFSKKENSTIYTDSSFSRLPTISVNLKGSNGHVHEIAIFMVKSIKLFA
jgi:hypothetical protein